MKMPESAATTPEIPKQESVERFGQTLLSADDIQELKGRVIETLKSKKPDSKYQAVDQLSYLKQAGLKVGISEKLRVELQTERKTLKSDPHKLAKYLVRLNYLGVIQKEDITDDEKALVATQIELSTQDPEAKKIAETCVSAKGIGVEIPPAAQAKILNEIATLSPQPTGSNVNRYVKRLAQARYLGIKASVDFASVQQLTKQRLNHHQRKSDWARFAQLQSWYTRVTDKGLPIDDSTKSKLINHAATIKDKPALIGRYLVDLKVIEQSLSPTPVSYANVSPASTMDLAPEPAPKTIPATPLQPEVVPIPPREAVPANPQPPKAAREQVNTIVQNRLANPLLIPGRNGEIGCGTDEGFEYKDRNEDAVVVNTEKNAFAVIDGMGGYNNGQEAAQILAFSLHEGFNQDKDFAAIQETAHQRLQEKGLMEDGACYVAGRIENGNINIAQAGDVRLIIIGYDGKVRFSTKDECLPPPKNNVVMNVVTGSEVGDTTTHTVPLSVGDRIIVSSDGLWDSLSSEEIADLVKGKSIAEAVQAIEQQTKERMQRGTGKPDNRSLFFYDIIRVEGQKGEKIPAAELLQLMEVQRHLKGLIEKDTKYRLPFLPMPDESKVDEVFLTDVTRLEALHKRTWKSDERRQLRHDAEQHVYGELESTSRAVLSDTMTYLDSLPLWKHKFSTEYKHGKRQPWDWYNDSLYYVTSSGVSLRLKKSVIRKQGLAGVIQPFQEKITFENKDDWNQLDTRTRQVATVPQVGWRVEEYQSEDFRQLMASGRVAGAFPSHFSIVERNGQPEVETVGVVHTHTGHDVNKVYFTK